MYSTYSRNILLVSFTPPIFVHCQSISALNLSLPHTLSLSLYLFCLCLYIIPPSFDLISQRHIRSTSPWILYLPTAATQLNLTFGARTRSLCTILNWRLQWKEDQCRGTSNTLYFSFICSVFSPFYCFLKPPIGREFAVYLFVVFLDSIYFFGRSTIVIITLFRDWSRFLFISPSNSFLLVLTLLFLN